MSRQNVAFLYVYWLFYMFYRFRLCAKPKAPNIRSSFIEIGHACIMAGCALQNGGRVACVDVNKNAASQSGMYRIIKIPAGAGFRRSSSSMKMAAHLKAAPWAVPGVLAEAKLLMRFKMRWAGRQGKYVVNVLKCQTIFVILSKRGMRIVAHRRHVSELHDRSIL
jgi:hypothetical protein